jgi:hypothetical protein
LFGPTGKNWAAGSGWASRAGWEKRKMKRREGGPRGKRKERGEKRGFEVWFFFSNPFKQLFKPLLNQTFYIFSQPFSQIILKTFKASQQQNSCIPK